MKVDHYILLIYKKLKGILKSDELRSLKDWQDKSADNKALTKDIEQIWDQANKQELPFDLDYEADFAKIKQKAGIGSRPTAKRRSISTRRSWIAVAAAIALLIASLPLLRGLWAENNTWESITAKEQILELELADGSQIWLNKGATISFPKPFAENERTVTLTGEAFFEVAKDAQRPFTVETDHINVKVLGTAFNVRARTSNDQVEVSVLEGRVEVGQKEGTAKVVLAAKEGATYNLASKRLKKVEDKNLNNLAWKRNSLQFSGDQLSSVIEILEKNFEVEISLENTKMETCEVAGRYKLDSNIESILRDITAIYQMEVLSQGDQGYVLKGGICK